MPIGLLKSYATMLPRLNAEERLGAVQDAAIAAMTRLEPGDAQGWSADTQRIANGEDVSGRRGQPATPDALAAIGIGVTIIQPGAEPAHV